MGSDTKQHSQKLKSIYQQHIMKLYYKIEFLFITNNYFLVNFDN